jgi:PAB1-binding protein PBP1
MKKSIITDLKGRQKEVIDMFDKAYKPMNWKEDKFLDDISTEWSNFHSENSVPFKRRFIEDKIQSLLDKQSKKYEKRIKGNGYILEMIGKNFNNMLQGDIKIKEFIDIVEELLKLRVLKSLK